MSFIRQNKGRPKNPPRKKKPSKLKPWDDTVNDLDAYKATPDEIAYRRESHRSKHAVSSHVLKGKLRQGKRNSPLKTNSQARKYAIMKEVLYDQKQLQDVLEKSDTMMAVVKDLFGDDPRRFAGFPTVTSAPNATDDIEDSLARLPGDIRTRTEVLSESVMDGSALNEFQDSDSEEDSTAAPLVYQPKFNMQRFQQFIEAEEKNNTLSTISGQAGLSYLGPNVSRQPPQGNAQSSQLPEQSGLLTQGENSFQTPKGGNPHNESLEILRPPKSAINDTNKVNKTKRRVPRPEPPEHNTSSNFSLGDLRKVLEILEDEIAEYERVTGRRPPAERQRQESFSGYTLAIVDSVTKLTRYLKESELRRQAEVTIREQLTQDVVQFRALVDALTSDIILTQEEFGKLATEFQKFRESTQNEIMKLKREPAANTDPHDSAENSYREEPVTLTPPKSQQAPPNFPQNQEQDPSQQAPAQILFGEHLQPHSSAVMLSPPVRRSRVTENKVTAGPGNNKQGSLLDFPDISSVDSNNSAIQEEFTELPGLCATSNVHVFNQLSAAVQPSMAGNQYKSMSVTNSQPQKLTQNNGSYHQGTMPVNSISVPRPTPLVQSNVGIPLPSELGQTIRPYSQQMPQSFLEKNQPVSMATRQEVQSHHPVMDERGLLTDRSQESGDREFLASQIAALNRQHEEAQRRLQGLMLQKQQASWNSEKTLQQDEAKQHSGHSNQEEETKKNENPPLQVSQGLQKQQLQYIQQQKLIELVQQQQQKLQEQQRWHDERNQKAHEQTSQRPKPNIPAPHIINGNQSEGVDRVRQSFDIPGYRPQPKQVGLPDYPVSPNISPITQRSEAMSNVHKSTDSQDHSITVPSSRGIMVSLPKVDMDMSGGSPSPRP